GAHGKCPSGRGPACDQGGFSRIQDKWMTPAKADQRRAAASSTTSGTPLCWKRSNHSKFVSMSSSKPSSAPKRNKPVNNRCARSSERFVKRFWRNAAFEPCRGIDHGGA